MDSRIPAALLSMLALTGCVPYGTQSGTQKFNFGNEKRAASMISHVPAQAAIFPAIPINVSIDFDRALAGESIITITSGIDQASGQTIIDPGRMTMRRELVTTAPDGKYLVSYNACFNDGSCRDGSFEFGIDRSARESFSDMRGQREVQIDMSLSAFNPPKLIIDKGATVVWKNSEGIGHFVNSDPISQHTYFVPLNSPALGQNGTFSYTFNLSGYYPYHCSVHVPAMTGSIIVE